MFFYDFLTIKILSKSKFLNLIMLLKYCHVQFSVLVSFISSLLFYFILTFSISISHSLFWKFHWSSSCILENMKIFNINVEYFHPFSRFFNIWCYDDVKIEVMVTSLIERVELPNFGPKNTTYKSRYNFRRVIRLCWWSHGQKL